MSFENIQLSPYLIQNLYRNHLVRLDKPKKPKKATGKDIKHLGNNEKQIVVLINNNEAAFLSDTQLDFLSKILAACKLTLADVAIVNLAKEKDIDNERIDKEFEPGKVLMFGVEPTSISLPFQIPHFQIQKHNNKVYVTAPGLDILETDKELKISLWKCFQQVFL
jgi:hypothetical protein